jgi:hypothetical protein
MEKTIEIDGRQVRFKSTAATPLRYKAQFGKDYFSELLKMNKLGKLNLDGKDDNYEALEHLDFEVFYNLIWALAKTADKSIPEPITWLDEFEEFPIMEILPELQVLITSSIQGKKK